MSFCGQGLTPGIGGSHRLVQLGINRMGQQLVYAASRHHITGEEQPQLRQGTLAIDGLLPPAWWLESSLGA